MKGISTVIAVVVMLLVTIAIIGAAWSYISGYWVGLTAKNAEVTSTDCTNGVVTIFIKNIGGSSINLATDVTTTRTSPTSADISASGTIGLGKIGNVTDNTCGTGNTCVYRVVVAGRSLPASATCV